MGMHNIYENGLRFECKRCSYCCGHSPGFVYLSQKDVYLLSRHFNLSQKEFIEKYCRCANYYEGKQVVALKEEKNYDCTLWKNGCTAYEARPVQCRTYPFWSWMIANRETWNDCAKDCPGINSGRLWTKEEIEGQKAEYDANIPMEYPLEICPKTGAT